MSEYKQHDSTSDRISSVASVVFSLAILVGVCGCMFLMLVEQRRDMVNVEQHCIGLIINRGCNADVAVTGNDLSETWDYEDNREGGGIGNINVELEAIPLAVCPTCEGER